MANSMTPGEVYLVEEIDPRTGEATDYCKIGIVRERDGRDSSNRASEHQTGNPRKLVVAQTVKTEIVEAVETTLHQLHSPQRISGEWFFMTKPERERAMDVARALAAQAASGAEAMKKALAPLLAEKADPAKKVKPVVATRRTAMSWRMPVSWK